MVPLQEQEWVSMGPPTTMESHEPRLPQFEQVLVEQCHSKLLGPSFTSTSHGPGAGARELAPASKQKMKGTAISRWIRCRMIDGSMGLFLWYLGMIG